jgi:hypothetical protein
VKRDKEELRALWKKAINQQLLLIRMEKENARLRGSHPSIPSIFVNLLLTIHLYVIELPTLHYHKFNLKISPIMHLYKLCTASQHLTYTCYVMVCFSPCHFGPLLFWQQTSKQTYPWTVKLIK